ncbi:MAG: hypothetical protein AAGG44_18895, partial [Planctomycetota bacterium]
MSLNRRSKVAMRVSFSQLRTHLFPEWKKGCGSNSLLVALLLVSCFSLAGCATHAQRLASPRTSFYGGDLNRA